MARNSEANSFNPVRFAVYTLSAVLGTASVVFAYQQIDQFLIRDPRFALASTADEEESSLHLEGVKHASRAKIHSIFKGDTGKSVYLFPLAERRRRLLGVEWVKDATVSRIWPDRIAVHIVERKPVAFARLAGESAAAPFLLIDEDGVLLPLTGSAKFKLPVATGLKRDQTEEDRKSRVRRMMKLLAEIGAHAERVSEIDLADSDNVKVTYPMGDRAMILYLGHGRYAVRLKKFLDNYDEVRKRIPEARVLDLRLEDRITAVKDDSDPPGEKRGE